ncbi:prepilin-type N-terminal cleavage/methylation domain-containing protein [Elusimicrobium simillimum]|uniref:type IV pilin protein n=1 Tax=Elusimicrobium simillimum TaxID=3143438 RepID=UPI003C6FA161
MKNLQSRRSTLGRVVAQRRRVVKAEGFTLIELLVVVLIIGILAAIALPQYTKAVEKSRATEALVNGKNISDAVQRAMLQSGPEIWQPPYKDLIDIDLSGGTWNSDGGFYITKHFVYRIEDWDFVNIYRVNNGTEVDFYDNTMYELTFYQPGEGYTDLRTCTVYNEKYRSMCKTLEGQGFKTVN